MSTSVDPLKLREEVKKKYREVALDPGGEHHFHTGRALARHLGYDERMLETMPEEAVESFAGVANPFSLRRLDPGQLVVDVGSGGGFDCFVAGLQVGPAGRVVGIDMLDSEPFDAFGGARGEAKARAFEAYGYTFLARKPG